MKTSRRFQDWLAASPTGNSGGLNSLKEAREQVLSGVLLSGAILGTLAYFTSLNTALMQQQFGIAAAYTAAYVWLLVIALARRLPYAVRAVSLLAIAFGLGAATLIGTGLEGSGRLFMLMVPLLATLLFGYRGGIAGLAASLLALLAVSVLVATGRVVPQPLASTLRGTWTAAGGAFLLVNGTLTALLAIFLRRVETNLIREATLSAELTAEREQLEQRIEERTQTTQRLLAQVRTAAEISRAIAAVMDTPTLLQKVADLVRERFDLYYVGVFLLDPYGDFAVLKAGTGEAGQMMLAEGHRLRNGGDSMIGWTVANRQPRIALDVGQEAIRFENPYLPLTRSELALPILSGDRVLGALSVQSTRPAAFDEDDITALEGISASLATALENAMLLEDARSNLEEVRALHHRYLANAWSSAAQQGASLSCEVENPEAPFSVAPSEIHVPIVLREQVIGNLALEMGSAALSVEERAMVEAVTGQVALALENARLLEETQRRAEQERLAAAISGKIWATTDLDSILRTALQELGQSLRVSDGWIKLEMDE